MPIKLPRNTILTPKAKEKLLHDGRTDKRTNLVTTSLLELLIAAKNTTNYFELLYPPVIKFNSNRPKSHTSHPLDFHRLYLVNFKFMIHLPGLGGSPLSRAISSYPHLPKFTKHYFPGGWWLGGGGNNVT